jgi:transcriptional regulator with XRE-family HTH domain
MRLESDRLASTAKIERLATALAITPDLLLARPPAPDPSQAVHRTPANRWMMQHVAHWRKVRRFTHAQLAERVGVVRETVARGETGKPVHAAVVRRIADALLVAPAA